MIRSEARVETERSSRYLQQLCKHFEHKLPATYSPEAGRIEFPFGVCPLTADAGTLTMRAESEDEASLGRLEEVIAKHLDRFAFRDKPAIDWARENGARAVDACPVDTRERRPASGLYHGLAPAFRQRGFVELARRRPDRPLMRLELGSRG